MNIEDYSDEDELATEEEKALKEIEMRKRKENLIELGELNPVFRILNENRF